MPESQLAAVIEPILAEHGLELDRLDVTPIGKRPVLRVTIDGDGPEGRGPLLDDIAAVSSAISEALDASPAVGSPFPGSLSAETPVYNYHHYRPLIGGISIGMRLSPRSSAYERRGHHGRRGAGRRPRAQPFAAGADRGAAG